MEITFHTILGSIVLILILLYVVRVILRLNTEGFLNATATAPSDVSKSCPGLSPVAAAAAAAADNAAAANAEKAADIAKMASKVVADNLAPQLTAPSGINVTCPSGDTPIINVNTTRNTKFTAEKRPESMFDSNCGSNEYDYDPDADANI